MYHNPVYSCVVLEVSDDRLIGGNNKSFARWCLAVYSSCFFRELDHLENFYNHVKSLASDVRGTGREEELLHMLQPANKSDCTCHCVAYDCMSMKCNQSMT